jgi:hypothetical protein
MTGLQGHTELSLPLIFLEDKPATFGKISNLNNVVVAENELRPAIIVALAVVGKGPAVPGDNMAAMVFGVLEAVFIELHDILEGNAYVGHLPNFESDGAVFGEVDSWLNECKGVIALAVEFFPGGYFVGLEQVERVGLHGPAEVLPGEGLPRLAAGLPEAVLEGLEEGLQPLEDCLGAGWAG